MKPTITFTAHLIFATIISSFLTVRAQCPAMSSHQIYNLSTNGFSLGGDFGLCGGLVQVWDDGILVAEDRVYEPAETANLTGLNSDTTYDVSVVNYCPYYSDCSHTVSSAEYWFFVTTPDDCSPPISIRITSVGSNTFTIQATMGNFGGRVRLYQNENLILETNLQAGPREFTPTGLQGGTTYEACFVNYCDYYYNTTSDEVCRIVTTEDECGPPENLKITETTSFGFTYSVSMGPHGGRAWLYDPDNEVEEQLIGSGDLTVTWPTLLIPDAQYLLCIWNACDPDRLDYSEDYICQNFRTEEEDCSTPTQVMISQITSDSFSLEGDFTPFGGVIDVESDAFSSSYNVAEGEYSRVIQNLISDTTFSVMVYNRCFDGSLTAPFQTTVKTPSARESNGFLSPPAFVDESRVWVGEDGKIHLLLPDPAADGWDRFGDAELVYDIRLVVGCDTLWQDRVFSRTYPYEFSIPAAVPQENYEIHVLRREGASKQGGLVSDGTVIVGPPQSGSASQIATEYLEVDRWLLHVPRKSGGFRGIASFDNRFPETPAKIWIAGFDDSGQYVDGTAKALLVVGPRAEIPVYPESGATQALFNSTLVDQVSHVGLYEEYGKKQVQAAITYQNITDPDALTATVSESRFAGGETVGSYFVLEARKSESYWDGVAILNLATSQAAQVEVVQRRAADDSEVERHSLGTVEPGQKQLAVVSDLFDFCSDCYYSIESSSTATPIQVLGLRGSLGSQTPVLVGSQVTKKK